MGTSATLAMLKLRSDSVAPGFTTPFAYEGAPNSDVPVHDDPGQITHCFVNLADVKDRTRTPVQFDQAQSDPARMNRLRMMGEMAASLAHEIAQPIATARNNARAALLFSDGCSPNLDEAREALECVVADIDRAAEILDRIRDHINQVPPRMEPIDLNRAIADVVALAHGAIVRNGISIRTFLADELPQLNGDRVQVQQVVLNLILNAIEAMGSSQTDIRDLSITTERLKPSGVLVKVQDTGVGIEPKHLDKIFDPFYTTKPGGVGVGLSICRTIIGAYGGKLWVKANSPRGVIFMFMLPEVVSL